jgi:CHAD domain-containing protein
MPRFEKCLTGVSAEEKADRVAKRALATRLRAVAHFLDKSVGSKDEAEAIHELRIWTRRSSTALKIFGPALPKRERKWLMKTLRQVRKKAGAVRDCDVQLERLKDGKTQLPMSVEQALKKQRHKARKEVKSLRRRLLSDDRLQARVERLLEGIEWPKRHSSREAPPFGLFCRQALAPLVARFFELANGDLRNDESLHALRIAGKRLRYTLEFAPAAIDAPLHQQLYAELGEVQDRLGLICDQISVVEHVGKWLEDTGKKPGRRRLAEALCREQARLADCRKAFLRWWSPTRRRRMCKRWAEAA